MDNTNPYLCIEYPVRRTIVIGDIHGCWTEFQDLLEKTGPSVDDLVITVGDFMDRGPGSWEVARYFKSTPNAFSVKGNHERRVAGVVKGSSQPAWSQKQSLSLLPETEHIAWAEWMESLPAVIETPHVIITHARLDPRKPLNNQDPYHTAAVGGAAVTIELDDDGVPLWFKQMRLLQNLRLGTAAEACRPPVYGKTSNSSDGGSRASATAEVLQEPEMRLNKPVCIGHIGYDRVALEPGRLYALDTGAVRGGQLTAVIFPGCNIVQVPAERNYHADAFEKWRLSQVVGAGDPMSWTIDQLKKAISQDTGFPAPDDRLTIEQTIRRLDLERRGEAWRRQLMVIFGNVPPPGIGRGEFFINVKATIPDRATKALAVRLLQDLPFCFDDLVKVFPNSRLCDINRLLTEFERTIAGLPIRMERNSRRT